ncbi:IS110 family transposase [Oceaniferula spumae]|uniref:IS110 family transposase n=1 Tax=Oceaniferula spumae TaxID=2979115 RepID=A0AAT9FNB1_9BACT
MKPLSTPAPFLGIDVGRADLFCHVISITATESGRFDNTPDGIRSLVSWLSEIADPASVLACLEQTGHYGKPVASALHTLGVRSLHLVNPRQIKAFGNQKLRRNKSDTADARLIAQFLRSEHEELRPWTPLPADHDKVKELSRYAESLTRDTARLKTKLEAVTLVDVRRSINRRIKAQQKELETIRGKISKIVSNNTQLSAQNSLLHSIPGLGETTCQILLAELPEIELFGDARQLAAWAGVTPRHFVSGTSGKSSTPITKVGSSNLRKALYLPAMTAMTYNPLLKEFARRLKENGKTGKQVVVAVMRKLLHQIYGILKSGQPFDPDKRGLRTALPSPGTS